MFGGRLHEIAWMARLFWALMLWLTPREAKLSKPAQHGCNLEHGFNLIEALGEGLFGKVRSTNDQDIDYIKVPGFSFGQWQPQDSPWKEARTKEGQAGSVEKLIRLQDSCGRSTTIMPSRGKLPGWSHLRSFLQHFGSTSNLAYRFWVWKHPGSADDGRQWTKLRLFFKRVSVSSLALASRSRWAKQIQQPWGAGCPFEGWTNVLVVKPSYWKDHNKSWIVYDMPFWSYDDLETFSKMLEFHKSDSDWLILPDSNARKRSAWKIISIKR